MPYTDSKPVDEHSYAHDPEKIASLSVELLSQPVHSCEKDRIMLRLENGPVTLTRLIRNDGSIIDKTSSINPKSNGEIEHCPISQLFATVRSRQTCGWLPKASCFWS